MSPSPPSPKPPPDKSKQEVLQAGAEEARRARMRRGRASTMLSDMYGLKSMFGQ